MPANPQILRLQFQPNILPTRTNPLPLSKPRLPPHNPIPHLTFLPDHPIPAQLPRLETDRPCHLPGVVPQLRQLDHSAQNPKLKLI